eukprot:1138151-Pelagomonas_calceolata.AAC.1
MRCSADDINMGPLVNFCDVHVWCTVDDVGMELQQMTLAWGPPTGSLSRGLGVAAEGRGAEVRGCAEWLNEIESSRKGRVWDVCRGLGAAVDRGRLIAYKDMIRARQGSP